MAAPEPMNMQKPSFPFTMPHSAQPPSLSLTLPQPSLPGPSSSASTPSLSSPLPQPSLPGPSSSEPGPSTPAPPQLPSSQPSGDCVPPLMHKTRLHEFTQRSNKPLPIYRTVNEGLTHAPKFRSTVWVDGQCYTSANVFPVRKAAEQDVARLAYEHIMKQIKNEGLPDIFEKTLVFKSILNEFASKMNLDKVTYHTLQMEGNSFFVSSLVFNGKSYSGVPSRTKKEAEQLAARTAILSNLNDSVLGTRLSEVITSKSKFFAAFNNLKASQHTSTVSYIASSGPVSVSAAPVTVNNNENSNKVEVALPEPSSRGLSTQQEFQMSKQEKRPEDSEPSNPSQQAGEPQHVDDSPSSKKRKRNKKKANKNPQINPLPPVAVLPPNQAPPPVALPLPYGQPSGSVPQ